MTDVPLSTLVAGEGPNELGSLDRGPYADPRHAGVIAALLDKVRPGGFDARHGLRWSKIRKYRVGEHRDTEHRNVVGLALMASERGCEVLAFARDADDDERRAASIEKGIADAKRLFPSVTVVGAPAKECLESWMLALSGVQASEELGKVRAQGDYAGIAERKRTTTMVAIVAGADLANIPADALTLRRWIARAEAASARA